MEHSGKYRSTREYCGHRLSRAQTFTLADGACFGVVKGAGLVLFYVSLVKL